MKLLITGGAGFIGSNFIHHILKKYPNYKITNVDKLTYSGNLDNLKDIKSKNYKFIKADICNKKLMNKLVPEHDWVVNFAAESHVDRSILGGHIFVRSNVEGVQVLLDAARKNNTKFLQISTDEVYGSIKRGSFTEKSILTPSSPYSSSKASGDLVAMSYFKTYGLPVVITRTTNNFGPYQFPEKLIPLMITNALANKKLPVYGTGKNIRDWTYVEDNCAAIDIVLHKGKFGEIYNISAGNEKQNLEIIRIILKTLNKPESLIEFVKDRPGHDWRYSVKSKKVRKLGWKPEYKFNEAIQKTINWYLDNKSWWLNLKKKASYAEKKLYSKVFHK